MYFNCNTTLVRSFRELFPDSFEFEGNRAIIFPISEKLPTGLSPCALRRRSPITWIRTPAAPKSRLSGASSNFQRSS